MVQLNVLLKEEEEEIQHDLWLPGARKIEIEMEYMTQVITVQITQTTDASKKETIIIIIIIIIIQQQTQQISSSRLLLLMGVGIRQDRTIARGGYPSGGNSRLSIVR
jgi:hypothetical protein